MFAVYLGSLFQSWTSGITREQTQSVRLTETDSARPISSETQKPRLNDGFDSDEEMVEEDAWIEPAVRERFMSAAAYLPNVAGRLENVDLRQFYALFKQATAGPANAADRPSVLDQKGRTKFDSWKNLGDMPKDLAMKTYAAKMDYMDLGWDPTLKAGVQEAPLGWGNRPSRMQQKSEPEVPIDVDREAVLWFSAAKADDVTIMRNVYSKRPTIINHPDQHLGMTALHWATDMGAESVVKFLVQKEADVNRQDPDGNTALHFAAFCARRAVAELLLAAGANKALRNNDGVLPADSCDDEEMIVLLRP